MSRQTKFTIPSIRTISLDALGIEYRPCEEDETMWSFYDKDSKEVSTPDVLRRANEEIIAEYVVVFEEDKESFIVVTKKDLKTFQSSIPSSTDMINDGTIYKRGYLIPAKVWYEIQ